MIYYSLTLTVYIILFCRTKYFSYKLNFCIFLIALFSSLRVDSGYDYGSYYELIELNAYDIMFEPIPRFLADVAQYFQEVQIFFILTSILICFSLYCLIIGERSYKYFLLIFLSMPFCFIDSLGLVRQYMAACFIVLAFSYRKKNIFFPLAFLVFAIYSHSTAIYALILYSLSLFIPNYLISNKFSNVLTSILIAIATYLIYNFNPFNLILPDSSNVGFFAALFWYAFYVSAVIVSKNYDKSYSDSVKRFALVGVSCYLGLAPFGYFNTRIFVYFAPFACLFISRAIYIDYKYTIRSYVLLLSLFLTTFWLYSASIHPDFDYLNNYKLYPATCENCKIRGI